MPFTKKEILLIAKEVADKHWQESLKTKMNFCKDRIHYSASTGTLTSEADSSTSDTVIVERVLSFEYPKYLEHELYRACIQCAVGIEQGHNQEAMAMYASNLRKMADRHCHAEDFKDLQGCVPA